MIIKFTTSNIVHINNKRYDNYKSPQYDKFVRALDFAEEIYDNKDRIELAFHFCKDKQLFTPVLEECICKNNDLIEKITKHLNSI
jgi:hypothetical protein